MSVITLHSGGFVEAGAQNVLPWCFLVDVFTTSIETQRKLRRCSDVRKVQKFQLIHYDVEDNSADSDDDHRVSQSARYLQSSSES